MASLLDKLKLLGRSLWCLRSRFPLLNFPIPCRLADGSRFWAYGDAIGWSVLGSTVPLRKISYERGDWQFVSRFLQPGMVVVDVGANQGFYTLLAARRVGPTGKVIAFEPAPSEFPKLQRNVAANGFSNVVLLRSAAGSHEGVTEFYTCLDGRGSWSSRRPPADDVKYARKELIRVPITSLDCFLQRSRIAHVDLLKIDVEGGELDVLKGASLLFRNSLRPVVLCEIEDRRTRQWGYKSDEICKCLRNTGYKWFSSELDGKLVPALPERNGEEGNLVAVPMERIRDLKEFYQEGPC